MAPAPRVDDLPFLGSWRTPQWSIAARSDLGYVRRRLEDAWAILPMVRHGTSNVTAVGVFDGLGGMSFGQEAAWAAADHLGESLTRTAKPQDVLGHLNGWVRETRGATTAVVAVFPQAGDVGSGTLLTIGDSAAYTLNGAQAKLLNPKDSDGPSVVTRYLGDARAEPHVVPLNVPKGGAVLLCTDGVDGVVRPESITSVLRAPDLAAALDTLFLEVLEKGAPDNATALVARRLG